MKQVKKVKLIPRIPPMFEAQYHKDIGRWVIFDRKCFTHWICAKNNHRYAKARARHLNLFGGPVNPEPIEEGEDA